MLVRLSKLRREPLALRQFIPEPRRDREWKPIIINGIFIVDGIQRVGIARLEGLTHLEAVNIK